LNVAALNQGEGRPLKAKSIAPQGRLSIGARDRPSKVKRVD
jgi:hypothetical protein